MNTKPSNIPNMANTVVEPDTCGERDPLCWISALVFGLFYCGAIFAFKLLELSPWMKWLVALAPITSFAIFIIAEIRIVRRLDEMQRRIQLEALAIAYPSAILFVFAIGILKKAGLVDLQIDQPEVWAWIVLPYFIGLVLARKRYR